MRCATVLFVGEDPSLRATVRKVIATKDSLHLVELSEIDNGRERLAGTDVAVALVHLPGGARA